MMIIFQTMDVFCLSADLKDYLEEADVTDD